MKLATLHDGSRDGQLVVVGRDHAQAHFASHIAGTLQQVLDDWNFLSPQLEDLAATLDGGKARHAFPFDPARCMAPLPRAYQRLMAGPPAEGAAALQRLASDGLLPPCGPRPAAPTAGPRCQPGVAAITGDLPAGSDADTALDGVRLLLFSADWYAPDGRWLACTCAPLVCTPDELGPAWRGGRLRLALQLQVDGKPWPGEAPRRRAGRGHLASAAQAADAADAADAAAAVAAADPADPVTPVAEPDAPAAAPSQAALASTGPLGPLLAQACSERALGAGSIVGLGLPLAKEAAAVHGMAQGAAGEGAPDSVASAPGTLLPPAATLELALLDADGLAVFGAMRLRADAVVPAGSAVLAAPASAPAADADAGPSADPTSPA